jgi:hypothetical protein
MKLTHSNMFLDFVILDTNIRILDRGYWGPDEKGKKRVLEMLKKS